MFGGISLEAWAIDHSKIGREIVKLGAVRTAQKVPNEQSVPGKFRYHAHVDRMRGIGAPDEVLHKVVPAFHMFEHIGVKRVKAFGAHFGIVVPPNGISDAVGLDNVFVFRGPAGEFAGGYQKGATFAQGAFAALKSGFHKRGFFQVVIDIAQPLDALNFQLELRVYPSKCHVCVSPVARRGILPSPTRQFDRIALFVRPGACVALLLT